MIWPFGTYETKHKTLPKSLRFFYSLSLFILLHSFGLAQVSINGQVLDAKTNEAVAYAHILFLRGSVGTAANLKGLFQLTLNDANLNDSVMIRSIGYSPVKLTVSDLLNQQVVRLAPNTIELGDIEVIAEQDEFETRTFMLDVVKKYNQQRNKNSHIATTHFREYAQYKGKFIMYFQSLGYSIMVKLNKNTPLIGNYHFFYENTRAHIENTAWAAYDNNLNDEYNRGNVRPSAYSILNLFRRIEVWGILSEEFVIQHKFKFLKEFKENSRLVYQISYKWKGDRGIIQVDAHSLEVIRIVADTNNYFSNPFNKELKANATLKFSYFSGTPYLSSADIDYKHKGLSHHLELQVLSQKLKDFEIDKEELKSLGLFERNPLIQYEAEEFQFLDFIGKSPNEQIAIDLVGSKDRLEGYFKAYSGKWLGHEFRKTRPVPSGDILKKLTDLKKNF
ncbi:hypothetical protein BFP97_02655 [Roseivirga sp. 4D4]|uniref:carboxypeptidase-like regulatory domain-containing protein n=1 Tax=Roseivirga sp. 4D4 TaxID=1889784 RepID=UPI0008530923|nr:carboxypeptidase-like regulatory domain-containing protein [Roseivirga sp. 4D4]OEK00478.1 hypothetical protein BFP97_02655 [Roseivirga sp. 4D4]